MDNGVIAAIIGAVFSGIASACVVLFDRSRAKKDQKRHDIELFRKIFTDLFNQFIKQLNSISSQTATNTISKKPIDEIGALIKFYEREKLRMYTVDDDDLRLELSNAINDLSDFVEEAGKVFDRMDLSDEAKISDSFKQSIKTNLDKCESAIKSLKSVK